MNRRLYAIHRWISLALLFQLLAWSISGLFFAVLPKVQLMGPPALNDGGDPLITSADLLSLEALAAAAEGAGLGSLRTIEIRQSDAGPVAIVIGTRRKARLDARSGQERPVAGEEAASVAQRDRPGRPHVASIERIEAATRVEYRGKPLPAWCITLDDGAGTAVYVDAVTGEVTARRNDAWRAYDFLWSLHIMAYRDREDFRNPLLIAGATLAVLTALSGTILWTLRAARAWRSARRNRAEVAHRV